ncbi:MAG: type II secretion system protein [Eubacterium sp.]|nr:type II secretion system protein [Eubacterium sp.]
MIELKNTVQKNNNRGMTMAEMLIVIAIIGILSSVAFISVVYYQRSMAQLERDSIAKEIFIAAQNHLTVSYGEGYLGAGDASKGAGLSEEQKEAKDKEAFGEKDTTGEEKDVYYYVVNNGAVAGNGGAMFNLMLPFGSIDETVRTGGSYIVRYQKSTGTVLDVFYCSASGTPAKFNHTLNAGDYNTVMGMRDTATENKKSARRDWDGRVLGWYGGTKAANLPTTTLKSPLIKVTNAEKLYVTVTDPNFDGTKSDASLRLIITGETSGAKKYFDLNRENKDNITYKQSDPKDSNQNNHVIILDDITTSSSNMHFATLFGAGSGNLEGPFLPGENIKIQAVAFSKDKLANIAYSASITTNSLFADGTEIQENPIYDAQTCFKINNIRHLENLSPAVSGIDYTKPQYFWVKAEQTSDLNWVDFQKETKKLDTGEENGFEVKCVYSHDGNNNTLISGKGYFMPIDLSGTGKLSYDGQKHSISDISIKYKTGVANHAGLFGSNTYVTGISNLALIDFTVEGNSSAGALAGTLSDTTKVSNVVAYNKTGTSAVSVTATAGTAGGLIGILKGGRVEYSAAALTVKGTEAAGGLIGKVSTNIESDTKAVTITGCYSGGHTDQGEYFEHSGGSKSTAIYNVSAGSESSTSAAAGGLIGIVDNPSGSGKNVEINESYSTCSAKATVSGSGGSAKTGGFVGDGTGISGISYCYATGLVGMNDLTESLTGGGPNPNSTIGAFAGTLSDTLYPVACYYYSIINEVQKKVTSGGQTKSELDHYLGAVGDKDNANIDALDTSADTYNDFVGSPNRSVGPENASYYIDGWQDAKPYDSSLMQYYNGKYNFKTVYQLYKDSYPDAPNLYNPGATTEEEKKDFFVKVHYGDWPAPEIFVINTK